MAIVMPVLVLLLVGIMELGLAFGDSMQVTQATREGAQIGSVAGNDIDADCFVIQRVAGVLRQSHLDRLNTLEIFETNPSTGAPVPGSINTYTYTGGDPMDCVANWSGTVLWPSTSRAVISGPTSVLDIIGVRVTMSRSWITGLPPFSGSYVVDKTSISRLEPEAFE